MLPTIREMCAELDITMHPHKFYCQPYQHGLEFLGYHILPGRIHVNKRVVGRAFNTARDNKRGQAAYLDAINSYLGMIKGTSDIEKARALLDAVDRKHIGKDYKEFKIYDKRRNPERN